MDQCNVKKTRRNFLQQKKRLNRFVTDLQIVEFLHAFVKGTKISPWSHFLALSPEEVMEHVEPVPAPSAAAAGTSGT